MGLHVIQRMILDVIVALFVAILEPIAFAILYGVAGLGNILLGVVELIVRVFVSGYRTKRISAKDFKEKRSKLPGWIIVIFLGISAIAISISELSEKEVQIVATDGHSLPYAEVMIITRTEKRNERTDNEGKVEIPRFGLVSLTIIDPRYVERTWENSEISKRLVVERTILGAALDKLANRLLKKDE